MDRAVPSRVKLSTQTVLANYYYQYCGSTFGNSSGTAPYPGPCWILQVDHDRTTFTTAGCCPVLYRTMVVVLIVLL
jgi:hypothetical protein